ncbi:MAG: GNAT family N-acetyltransferase [Chloroflexi bacterium]|nr:GNAT family N-acetyltransferase [Chloroflexota bacterium]
MTTVDTRLVTRQFRGEEDLVRIADLWNLCEEVDQLGQGTNVNELRVEFSDPWLDKDRNVLLWDDAEGNLVAFAQIWTPNNDERVEGRIVYQAHPEYRSSGLEAQILDWGEQRLREISRERGLPAKSTVAVRDTQLSQIALMESRDMTPERYTFVMIRDLDDLPPAELPAGFTIREIGDEADGEAWIGMYNLSFIDHYNHHPLTFERWKNWLDDPDGRADLNLVAVAEDGTFAAFCWAGINTAENERTGENVGWIHLLGTRRGYRRIGLGRGILLTGLQRLKASGMNTAKLGVDAQSLTGATRLYEAAGFTRDETWIKFTRNLEPATEQA